MKEAVKEAAKNWQEVVADGLLLLALVVLAGLKVISDEMVMMVIGSMTGAQFAIRAKRPGGGNGNGGGAAPYSSAVLLLLLGAWNMMRSRGAA